MYEASYSIHTYTCTCIHPTYMYVVHDVAQYLNHKYLKKKISTMTVIQILCYTCMCSTYTCSVHESHTCTEYSSAVHDMYAYTQHTYILLYVSRHLERSRSFWHVSMQLSLLMQLYLLHV